MSPQRANLFGVRAGRRIVVLMVVSAGCALGVGLSTFRYAKGLSYFKTDPAGCRNCHIMQGQFDSWQKSSHHAAAICIDCHLPHAFIPKYLAKAENGWRHSKEFTLQTFREPIALKPRGAEILQENCVRCHDGLVHDLVAYRAAGPHPDDTVHCVHCHAGAGHGPRAALGGRLTAAELSGQAFARTTDDKEVTHD